MYNIGYKCELITQNKIRISTFGYKIKRHTAILLIKEIPIVALNITEFQNEYICSIPQAFEFVPGYEYSLKIDSFFIPIDISFLGWSKSFEEKYRYSGRLGAIYSKRQTTFRVFTPFASSCKLIILNNKNSYSVDMMHDDSCGIYHVTIYGNYDKAKYLYEIKMFGKTYQVVDPYAYAVSSNGKFGFVIDIDKIKNIPSYDTYLDDFSDPTKAIIYEAHVRDMTSKTNVLNRGTFAALSRSKLTDKHGFPIGLDYIANLGFTHVQLMPVLDYQTIDENKPFESYNWGYDPKLYFTPEGSYSTDPNDPYARNIELKQLISAFHKKGIRVNLDVVYNHVFSRDDNPLAILCPQYYFRHNPLGSLSNGSGCGNDLETSNYMVRKLIKDSIIHLIDVFDVDGFRFDLMGIIDIDTLTECYNAAKQYKPNIWFYGEGWNNCTNLQNNKKATIENCHAIPFAGFFNDRFRDTMKGSGDKICGFILGNPIYKDGFMHAMSGCMNSVGMFNRQFENASQSINYIQCHDNECFYDKLKIARPLSNDNDFRNRFKIAAIAILFANGVPFFSEGQEIMQTKHGNNNSYNAGDYINGLDYDQAFKEKGMIKFLKNAIALKKEFINAAGNNYTYIMNNINFEILQNNSVVCRYNFKRYNYVIIFNPMESSIKYTFKHPATQVFGLDERSCLVDSKTAQLPSNSFGIFKEGVI